MCKMSKPNAVFNGYADPKNIIVATRNASGDQIDVPANYDSLIPSSGCVLTD